MIIILSKWNVRIEMKCKYCDCFLECANFKDDLIEYKCLICNKIYWGKFDEKLKDSFFNTYKFSIFDNKKFIAFLWKGVYPCEYMDDWEKFNETLPEKEDFYSPLNMKNITDADYVHTQKVCKDIEVIYANLILQNFLQLQD